MPSLLLLLVQLRVVLACRHWLALVHQLFVLVHPKFLGGRIHGNLIPSHEALVMITLGKSCLHDHSCSRPRVRPALAAARGKCSSGGKVC